MHNRQGGAAHVNIFYLLFALLLLIGSVFFLYTMLAKQGDVENALEEQQSKVAALEARDEIHSHNIEDLTQVLGFSSQLVGEGEERTRELGIYEGDSRKKSFYGGEVLQGVAMPTEYQRLVKAGLERLGAASSETTFQGMTKAINARMKLLVDAAAVAESNMGAALDGKRAADKDLSTAKDSHSTAVDGVLTSMKQEVQNFRSQSTQNAKLVEDAHENLLRKQAELNQEIIDHIADRKRLEAVNARYRDHKSALEAVLAQRNAPGAVDGRVVAAEGKVMRAFTDLTREDGLIAGTVFRITNPGSSKVKAYGKVVSVGDARSELVIEGLVDEFDPVAAGDEMSNDRFTPGLRRTVHLMGSFSDPWDKSSVARILSDLGHNVVKHFEAGVDLVILGDDIANSKVSESAAFKDATTLGVEFAPVARIRDLLTLSR